MCEEYTQAEKKAVTMDDLWLAVGRLDSYSKHKLDLALLVEFLGFFTDKDTPLCPEKKLLTVKEYMSEREQVSE